MKNQIDETLNFLSPEEGASLLRHLFDRRALWEDRSKADKPIYRNGHWYTVGASIYMDLHNEVQLKAYAQKVEYFNDVMRASFGWVLTSFLEKLKNLGWKAQYLGDAYDLAAYPGFHIFPPEETLSTAFGKIHTDIQWQPLLKLPEFPFPPVDGGAGEIQKHFTFTVPLALPYQGGGLYLPDEPDKKDRFFMYEERGLYVHSGQFPHLVLPFKHPVTPVDWRITFQGHGFTLKNNDTYLYW